MTNHDTPHPPTSAEHWDERYSGDQVWSGAPNGALVTEVADLPPGRVLDVGCGEGADACWLAARGWQVTALDISRHAVARACEAAAREGHEITGVVAPFVEADLAPGAFDLVSAMYPVLATTDGRVAERRLVDLVAPGGTLLVVHHDLSGADEHEHGHGHGHGHDPAAAGADGQRPYDPDDYVMPADVAAVLDDGWEVLVDERRPRHIAPGAGGGHTSDLVLRARRR